MDSIKITDTRRRVAINDDPERVIEFDPGSVNFAERFYAVWREFSQKQEEYARKSAELDTLRGEGGIEAAIDPGLSFLREVCEYMHAKIDYVFGAGSARKAFGDTLSIDAIGEFFDGMSPFIEKAREEKLVRHANKRLAGKVME